MIHNFIKCKLYQGVVLLFSISSTAALSLDILISSFDDSQSSSSFDDTLWLISSVSHWKLSAKEFGDSVLSEAHDGRSEVENFISGGTGDPSADWEAHILLLGNVVSDFLQKVALFTNSLHIHRGENDLPDLQKI